jgi:hypothetical protein
VADDALIDGRSDVVSFRVNLPGSFSEMARWLNIALAATLCAAAPAIAAQASPDSARIAAAEHLLKAMNYDVQMDRTIEAIIGEVERSIDQGLNKQMDEPLPAEVLAKIKAIAETHLRMSFAKHRPALRRGTALIYAKHFTVAELDRMATLQSDPVMVKMQAEIPEIMAETMALSQAMSAEGQDEMRKEVQAVVEDYLRTKGQSPSS